MSIWRKRSFARVVMIVMIVFAVIFGSGRSLRKLQAETETVFFDDDANKGGISVATDVRRNFDICDELLEIGFQFYAGTMTETMEALDILLDELADTEDPAVILRLNDEMTEKAEVLYDELAADGISGEEKDICEELISELAEQNRFIVASDYHKAVQEANNALRQFPASVLKHLTGVKQIEEQGE